MSGSGNTEIEIEFVMTGLAHTLSQRRLSQVSGQEVGYKLGSFCPSFSAVSAAISRIIKLASDGKTCQAGRQEVDRPECCDVLEAGKCEILGQYFTLLGARAWPVISLLIGVTPI